MINRRHALSLLGATALAGPARSQGFAGLGQDDTGFDRPDLARPITFPQDHAPHPTYRIEWWYLTATLMDETSAPLGIQWTLFRSALEPDPQGGPFTTPQGWLGHAAVTTPTQHFVSERSARDGTGQAGATGAPFEAWIDDWQMRGPTPDHLSLTASSPEFRYDLDLTATGPYVRHGRDGISEKSAHGQTSYYYSQPFYDLSGTVLLPDGPRLVTGQGWLDREWSSQPLAPDQEGWDWFSLVFENGQRLMAFRLRGSEDYTSATLIAADGTSIAVPNGQIAATPLERHRGIPVRWHLQLAGLDLEIGALNPDAWMTTQIPYWEGPVEVSGSHQGRGYLEMTGYRRR